MTFTDILFTIIIRPLELLFEFIFAVTDCVITNPAVSLVIMSLAINLLVLPLYRRADVLQQQAREKEEELRHMVNHIRKKFKGDERIMMLQTFYRQQHYSQLSSMKSLISLILQIPFFIAAYRFLSHLSLIQGVPMGPIKDLGKPDGLITLWGMTINLLPVAMTVINIISSEIFTHGRPFKDKIILYLSALVFLVLLYDSPSGLVFYWTFNNVFSLVKNILYKFRNPGLIFKMLCSLTGIAGTVWLVINWKKFKTEELVLMLAIWIILELPIVIHIIASFFKRFSGKEKKVREYKKPNMMFLFTGLFMTLLMGLVIPSQVISSCPGDFMFIANITDPSSYVYYTLCIAAGVYILWLGVFYLLASDKAGYGISKVYFCIAVISAVNYLFFNTKLGTMSAELIFDEKFSFSVKSQIINGAVVLGTGIFVLILYRFLPRVSEFVIIAAAITALGMGIVNMVSINKAYKDYCESVNLVNEPKITLSRTGKNVLVLMMDRAIGSYVPYIFEEKPELKEQFDGFTAYPNTISFGGHTNFGAPALFGGYEYTPANMNKRSDVLLKDKHNEALLVMPVLFGNNGYHVTVMDPPYANYSELVDVSLYKDYDYIDAYAVTGVKNKYSEEIHFQTEEARRHNFFFYSLFKTVPVALQPYFYANGNYCNLHVKYFSEEDQYFTYPQTQDGLSRSTGARAKFIDAYDALESMKGMTEITDEDKDQFFYMDNETCHFPCLLQEPEFVPQNKVDNSDYDFEHTIRVWNGMYLYTDEYDKISHYEVNMAAYIKLGEWFDYLKSEGVWDNTRIILVADHGFCANNFEDLIYRDLGIDTEYVNPLLMVKDFNSTGFDISMEFMTNADVPTIAMSGIIDSPVNPFTGNPINNESKNTETQYVIYSEKFKASENNGTTFLPGNWFTVSGNIYDRSSWRYVGEY